MLMVVVIVGWVEGKYWITFSVYISNYHFGGHSVKGVLCDVPSLSSALLLLLYARTFRGRRRRNDKEENEAIPLLPKTKLL